MSLLETIKSLDDLDPQTKEDVEKLVSLCKKWGKMLYTERKINSKKLEKIPKLKRQNAGKDRHISALETELKQTKKDYIKLCKSYSSKILKRGLEEDEWTDKAKELQKHG